ncbi:hypothetical protein FRE64_16280 [Euhalothece natronophila Z-M001]|uniref:Porin n=1 Tax=Euhalothece natronophila Z-M001 TaxID=522448 RepID=A0A5B8NS55_9CHRO|nr:hypothetical protein [Euhalothece natronophila]QDZ41361.1 hypothetical protein FRE64_16280 [Euhalothece natronophila Z-M001]
MVTQPFDILPDSTGNQIRAGVGLKLGDRAAINAFFIPQRNIDNIGINTEYQISRTGLFRNLVLQWERRIFEFGEDSFGNDLKETNDTFSILLNFSGS